MPADVTGRVLLTVAHALDGLAFRVYRIAGARVYREGRYSWGGSAWLR